MSEVKEGRPRRGRAVSAGAAAAMFACGVAAAAFVAARADGFSTTSAAKAVSASRVTAQVRAFATTRAVAFARSHRVAHRLSTVRPAAARAAQGDGIDLLAPPNGSQWPWSQGASLGFSWSEAWYCPGCDGVEVMIVADEQGNQVWEGDGVCPASSAPSCPTGAQVSLAPGSYKWIVAVKLGDNPTHLSDVWTVDVLPAAAPPATTTAPAPTAPPGTTTAPPSTTTTAAPATTTAATATTAVPAAAPPACRVPGVRGMRLADAELKLFRANCDVGKVARQHAKLAKGRVVDQAPRLGAVRPNGAKVRLVVSLGRR
jgi:hypothetical protein